MADRSASIAPDYFSNIHIVLVEPSVPGNIGAVARAMKTMGLSNLILVNPVEFRNEAEARWMAHGAGDILDTAKVVSTVGEAVDEFALVVGTTNRTRSPWLNPIKPLEKGLAELMAVAWSQPSGILFGREKSGLLNDELQRCNLIVRIHSAVTYPSLNLSQSVMVCAYELFRLSCEVPQQSKTKLADNEDVERICQRMNQVLLRIGFVGQPTEDTFMRSIRRVFRRSLRLEKRDVATLHKFCNEIDLYVDHCSGSSKSHLSNSKE